MLQSPKSWPSSLAPFGFPVFRAIWLANLASTIGAMIQSVGAAWLMTELTPSHHLVAMVQASIVVPMLLLGVIAGVVADHYDRRIVMLAAQFGMLIASAGLTLFTVIDAMSPYLLLGFTLAVGCGFAFNAPAWQASVRIQVDRNNLAQAITLNTIAFNVGRSVGPAIGGLVLSFAGPAAAFALNTASYLALIFVLLRWRPDYIPPKRQPVLAAAGAGLGFCFRSSPLRRIMIRGFTFGFGAIGFHALLPSLVRDLAFGSDIMFGLGLGSFGAGSIVCAFWVGGARRRWGTERILAGAAVGYAAAMLLLATAYHPAILFAASAVAGAGWVAALTTLNIAMQLRSPNALLGRCLSVYQAATFGGMALGAYALGLAADMLSLRAATFIAAGWLIGSAWLMRVVAPMPAPGEGRVDD